MSTTELANIGCMILDVPRSSNRPLTLWLSKLTKKWRSFTAIYCSRAIKPAKEFKVDQATLTGLMRDKNLVQLHELGDVGGVASALKTDAQHGIRGGGDAQDIGKRVEAFGSNTYKRPPTKGLFHFVWEALKDLTILILLACAALSLGLGIKVHGLNFKEGWIDGGIIFLAITLVISVTSVCDYNQYMQFDKLSKIGENVQIEAVRGGRRQQISIFEIVAGDVINLKIGDQVPADGLLLEGHSLLIDESSITGESDHVQISHGQNPFLFAGTKVADGYGRMLVTSVGRNTTWGEMMSQISRETSEETPLQARLNKLTLSLSKVGMTVAFLVLVVLLVRYFTGNTVDKNGKQEFNGSKTKVDDILNALVRIVVTAVAIVVVAIPEGLPLSVTVTLAHAMKRMMADKALVRKRSACENMGSATIICTDKTGTLTMNDMKVTKFWLSEEPVEEEAHSSISPYVVNLIHEGVALNSTGSVYSPSSDSEIEISGSPTEKAILSWAVHRLKMDMQKVVKSCSILHVEAFNSQNKRSGVLMKRKTDNIIQVHWKGAAETILAMCRSYYNSSGVVTDIDDKDGMKFEQIIQGMAASSLRCIAFAHKEIPAEEHVDEQEHKVMFKENGLTLLGLVGLKDPCRPGVKKAVEDCQHAGVKVKMITGDNVFTAKAIATECGILKADQDQFSGAVIEGVQFRNYTPVERMEKVEEIRVMARSSPFDKLLMVQCLKQRGYVVAVTGDGMNDAPALKEADIGLSMGIQGTEVAKESSDIVIMDDNFASVATVLRWGRCVYNNIQKLIQFQLTFSFAAIVINFVAAITAGEVPLTVGQLLWVNLIVGTLGALALSTEEPTNELMEKSPVGRTAPLITTIMWRNLLPQALYQIAVLLTLQFKGKSIFGVDDKVNATLMFNTFVLCQIFNEFNARKLEKKNIFKGIHTNKMFLWIIAVTTILQLMVVELLNIFAEADRLNWGQWRACLGIAAVSWPIGWVVKGLDCQVVLDLKLSLSFKLSYKFQPSEDEESVTIEL